MRKILNFEPCVVVPVGYPQHISHKQSCHQQIAVPARAAFVFPAYECEAAYSDDNHNKVVSAVEYLEDYIPDALVQLDGV